MKKSASGVSILFLALTYVAAAQQPNSTPITVDCSKGQSLNQTLAKLTRQTPYTVSVNGTCTEFVQVIGFHNLVLKGLAGATLVQPSTGGGSLFNATLSILSPPKACRSRGSPLTGAQARSQHRHRTWQHRHSPTLAGRLWRRWKH